MYLIVGLGNPGEKYAHTRHNTGMLAALSLLRRQDKQFFLLKKVKILIPETFMNRSGSFVARHVRTKKAAEKLVVIYDDLDLPLGTLRISFNRGSGGHKGIESIIRAIKTEAFIRIRVGISRITPSGKLKKPKGESTVEAFILGEFDKKEMELLNGVFERVGDAVEMIVESGLSRAMTSINAGA